MELKMLQQIIITTIIPFIFVVCFIPFVKRIAVEIKAVDEPRERHVHKKVTPKLGGLAIFFGFLFGYMIFGKHSAVMNSILIGGFVIVITGIIDDIVELRAHEKFVGQLFAALVITVYGQLLIHNIGFFGINIDFGMFAYPLTIFFILGCINCINLIDGLDGLSGGISSIYFFTIGIISAMKGLSDLGTVLSFVMLGSVLGFLVYNKNPATIFAGDSGSMFMGFMISVLALIGFKNVTLTSFVIPLLLLAIPILDTILAILRRIIKGTKITEGDKDHIHHQLLNKDLSVKAAVTIILAVDMLFAAASIIYILKDPKLGYIIYGLLLVLVIIFITNTNVLFERKKTVLSKDEYKDDLKKEIKEELLEELKK